MVIDPTQIPRVRADIAALSPYQGVEPPEILAKKVGIPPENIIKLDANENVYGSSPKVAEALAGCRTNVYPDPLQRQVREALARYSGVRYEQLLAGAGADELIDLLARLFLEPSDTIVDLPPTFGMYQVAARIQGAKIVTVARDENFEVNHAAVRSAIDPTTKMIYLSNPNNPTGNLTPEATLRRLLELGPLLVVDETYHEFCGFTAAHLLDDYGNLIILRSLSKWAGLAGLRLGYGLMAPQLVERLIAIKPPYNVSTAAEAALLASLYDSDLLLQRVRLLVEERERMSALLQQLSGVFCYPSKGNFLLCRFPLGQGARIFAELMNRGIFVRRFADPRLEDCLRITAGKTEHTDAIKEALTEIMEELT
jgi:histidinol-phosphate aminotransferase